MLNKLRWQCGRIASSTILFGKLYRAFALPGDANTFVKSFDVKCFAVLEKSLAIGRNHFIEDDSVSLSVNFGRNPANPALTTPFTSGIQFTTAGLLDPTAFPPTSTDFTVNADGTLSMTNWVPAAPDTAVPPNWASNGATASAAGVTIDFNQSTQFSSGFSVTKIAQDGYTTGSLSGLNIDDTGVIFARYTNGQSRTQGQVALASFANGQGLTPSGKTAWAESFGSGAPVIGTPRSGTLGALQAGALEDSNVELSDQLVNLIVAQRNYQANAKTIETESAITQTLINLR